MGNLVGLAVKEVSIYAGVFVAGIATKALADWGARKISASRAAPAPAAAA